MSEEDVRNAFLYTAAIVGLIAILICSIVPLLGGSISIKFKKTKNKTL